MKYEPKPISTADVALPEQILRLTEVLARNLHAIWARQRIAEGWVHGPRRDDEAKTHPCLVAYEQLPESEKEIDRRAVLDTLGALIAQGCQISPPEERIVIDASGIIEKLHRKLPFAELLAIWRQHNEESWKRHSEIYQLLSWQFIKLAEYQFGLDVLRAGLKHNPKNPVLRQQQALAFAGSGATDQARNILKELEKEGYSDGQTEGILARTYKDSWRLSGDLAYLKIARDTYRTAYERARQQHPPAQDDAIYNGINAATTSLFLNEGDEARRIALEVRGYCKEKLKTDADYWALATLAEAALLLGDMETAKLHYRTAAKIGQGNLRALASTRRQAREIFKTMGKDSPENKRALDACFNIGPVILFTGHMIDTEARRGKPERFPQRFLPAITSAIGKALDALKPVIGYSSAACGADLLFLQAMKERGVPGFVALPFARDEFCQTSVAIGGEDWVRSYSEILDWLGKDRVHQVSQHSCTLSSTYYDYSNMVLQGMAAIYAEQLDSELVGLAVWDGQAGDGPGGTASIVARWLDAGLRVEVLHPSGVPLNEYQLSRQAPSPGETKIIAVLFADVVHFGHLTENQMPLFENRFLPVVADLVRRRGEPLVKNTWGDGLFFAFEDVREAGLFALELQHEVAKRNWADLGLPGELNLRLGLHAGPAYECVNPVTGRKEFLGFHVNRGARIEPTTDTGQICCSQEFAALARGGSNRDFTFEYVGQIELPKEGGIVPLYSLRRK